MNRRFVFATLVLGLLAFVSTTQPIRAHSYLSSLPVGTVIHSMLIPEQMTTFGRGVWVLMDGREVPGSDYETATGNARVPDARGLFLRSHNAGRSAYSGNPDGDLRPGATQSDQVGVHTHPFIIGGERYAYNTPGFGPKESSNQSGMWTFQWRQITASIGEYGGNETRPRAMTLYTYIKINE